MPTLRGSLFLAALVAPVLSIPLDDRAAAQQLTPASNLPTPNLAGPPDSQIFPCTATFELTLQSCPPDPAPTHAATETLPLEVDCGGCLSAALTTVPAPHCLTPRATATTADVTATEWQAVCSPTPSLPLIYPRDNESLDAREDESTEMEPACLTTLVVPEEGTGPTVTVFNQVVTVVSSVPCEGCELVVSTRVGGLGQIVRPGVTATAEIGTTTVYECAE